MARVDLDLVRADLVRDEGLRLTPYRDTVGKLTIGCGRNLDDRGISRDEALVLLDNDIEIAIGELTTRFPWFEALDPVRQRALINMAFNLGLPRLLGFRKMLAAIARGDYAEAAREMLDSKWATQVGRRAQRLASRMATGREGGSL